MARCKHRTLSIYNDGYVQAAADRTMAKVIVDGEHWLFNGATDGQGYGKLFFGESTIKTHVLMYMIHKGDVPEGMCVCHTCNIKHCVNPDHLFLGTSSDNNSQAWKDGLQPLSVISNDLAKQIFIAGQNHFKTHAELGREFGVTRSIARQIRLGLAFKWIHG